MKLDLSDLSPMEAQLELNGKNYTLNKITLRVRIWLNNRFSPDEIKEIFQNNKLAECSEIAYFLMKDKTDFPSLDAFQDAFVTQNDFIKLHAALLKTVGISEPFLEKVKKEAEAEGKALNPSPQTGEQATTSLHPSTDTP